MTTWQSIINLKGSYTSDPIPIPINADGVLSKISWESVEPIGSNIVVQTRFTRDNLNWSEWQNCINGAHIPDIVEDVGFFNVSIMFRVLFIRNSYDEIPEFKGITFYFEPILLFDNKGDKNCSPEIWITKQGNGDFSIINTSNNYDEFKFKNLIHDETVFVDNENQDIETSLAVTYRYKDFNNNYLSFPVGKNILRVTGNADIKFRYQFTLLQ
ncbi:phage tail domain-containing protein [Paenibacillus sp. 1781tsa1]|uniref:phage tail domain-containing protein n=1 Tax=Paenibacillus sp. 1781tsa1 TaxID=2953810 RepID=UPI00209F8F1A|nr:phage tail domain-containing protein [Paenibacillus sp. 1781tsa1]MCP1185111.1 hypothetical protein [Paenibacillus sp. 1781tsa1]